MCDMNSKFVGDNSSDESESFEFINETPENAVSLTRSKSCDGFSQTVPCYSASSITYNNITDRSYCSLFANTSKPDVNSQSVHNSSDGDELFEFINDSSDKVVSVTETKSCCSPQNVTPIFLQDTGENYSSIATACKPNAFFSNEDNAIYDESFELINETSEDFVYVMKSKTLYGIQSFSPNSISSLESHCVIAKDRKSILSSDVPILDMNSLPVDSDESFEMINTTPEKVLCAKDAQQFFNPHNVSCVMSNVESVHNTEQKCSLPVEMSTNDYKPVQESKISALIAERNAVSSGLITERLIQGIKNSDIMDKERNVFNKKHNGQFKANILMHDERPNPESTNLLHVAENKLVSTSANFSAGNKKMCSDMVKNVTKRIERCSIVDKQMHSNIAFDKKYNVQFKMNPVVNEHDLVLPKNNLISMDAFEKSESKFSNICMFSEGRKKCDEPFWLPDDISDGKKEEEKVGAEEFLSCRYLDIFVKPKIPEGVSILRSNCLGYLKNLTEINDKNICSSNLSAYCNEQDSRIAQESKLKDLAKKLKNKIRKKTTTNSVQKLTTKKKSIFSWHGFHIDF